MALVEKPARLAVGLMSGTSVDGIDVALVRLHGHGHATRVETLRHECVPHDPALREQIFRAFAGDSALVCQLNFALGEAFARAAIDMTLRAGHTMREVDFIASHGQTIYHVPPRREPSHPIDGVDADDVDLFDPERAKSRAAIHRLQGGDMLASTLQVGEGAVIAARTGCVTITDFRTADMAAGGDGAPLVPLADYYLFHESGVRRVAANIGGIANVTKLDDDPARIIAFDTGPGNALIDAAARAIDPALTYDRGGELAARGKVDEAMLAELAAHPYFARRPPKSTGRELFGEPFARAMLERTPPERRHNLIATLTALTAHTLARGIRDFCGQVDEVVIAGGGVHNPVLMAMLRERLGGAALRTTAEFGVDPDAREAIAFAVLGNETLHGSAGNVPSATGAARGAVLGKISAP